MPESLWVAELIVSPEVRSKLHDDHHIEVAEVQRSIVAVAGLRFKWRHRAGRGWRAYVEIFIGRDRVLVVLRPVQHPLGDVYELVSAYPEPRGVR